MSPEGGEFVASYVYVREVLKRLGLFKSTDECPDRSLNDASPGWKVEALAADVTDKERVDYKLLSAEPRVKQGLPIYLKPEYNLKRGNDVKNPCYLWPSPRRTLDNLCLRNIYLCPRSLVFDFTTCYLDMHYLTHTSIQIYPKEIWEERVFTQPVHSVARRFRILLAIVFPKYVIAFLSLDMLAQPKWSSSKPTPSPEIFPGWDTEAKILASPKEWHALIGRYIEKVRKPKGVSRETKDSIAMYAIRHNEDLKLCFPGVGMFLANELWFRAGLPPGITVWELVSDQTRFPRLVETYYSFMWRCKHKYWADVICPALHNGNATITAYNTMLAPTPEQRIAFAETYLDVYQKPEVKVFPRHAALIDAYQAWTAHCQNEINNDRPLPDMKGAPPDPFEPTYIAPALRKLDNFAHLILGRDSPLLAGIPYNGGKDPISRAYYRLEFGPKPRSSLPSYDKLFLPMQARTQTRPVHHFQAVHGQDDNPIWSVISRLPRRNGPNAPDATRLSKLYDRIILDTQKVTIGPLEYVGYAAPTRLGSTKTVSVSRGDPILLSDKNAYHTVQSFVGRARRSLKFKCDQEGHRHRALTDAEFVLVDDATRVLMAKEGYADYLHLVEQYRTCKKRGSFKIVEDTAPDAVPAGKGDVNTFARTATGATKRKRLSADKRMAAAAAELDAGPSKRRRVQQ